MSPFSETMLVIGGLLLAGLAAQELGRRTRLPRVTLLLILGIAAGPEGLDLLPPQSQEWFTMTSTLALSMVGFLLGGEFRVKELRKEGRRVFAITAAAAFGAALMIIGGLFLLGIALPLALALGGIGAATDPAATYAVQRESGVKNDFSRLLLRVVALDDVLALATFSLLLALAGVFSSGGGATGALLHAARELGGSIALGLALGLPTAQITGRIRPGEPILEEALAIMCLCAGLATWLHLSPLLTAVVTGTVVANVARHHTRPFRKIESIEWPFLTLFFVLAGAALDFGSFGTVGVLSVAFILLRTLGKIVGAFLGAWGTQCDSATRRWLGVSLLPQAGVALGLALSAADRFPSYADELLSVTIVTTVFFELVGPLCTRIAIQQVTNSAEQRVI